MGMHPQLGAMSALDQRRLHFIKEIGCLACIIRFGDASPGGEGHHAEDDAGRAFSHAATICLCPWHHQGKPPAGYSSGRALAEYGPSRHRHARQFAQEFGTDLELLEAQDAALESFAKSFVIRPAFSTGARPADSAG